MRQKKTGIRFEVAVILGLLTLLFASSSSASTIDELRKIIEERNLEIQKLEDEAKKYQAEIANKQEQGRTLSAEIGRINRTIEQLKKDVRLTENKIGRTELEIEKFSLEIDDKEEVIVRFRGGLAHVIRALFDQDQKSLLEILLEKGALSDFFQHRDYTVRLEEELTSSLITLKELRSELEAEKEEANIKKGELENLRVNLGGRKKIQEQAQQDRKILLQQTKNEEKKYQELLAEQEQKRADLEQEIFEIEEKIRVTIDPDSLPKKGSGIFGWPLPDISLKSCWNGGGAFKNCITQFFGYTSFAASGAYRGRGHSGIDFRAAVGAPVFAAADGVVQGAGDTDLNCRKASYGKWILLRHPNNISTVYAHLSGINVSAGQSVRLGQQIGLSGSSGYSTGPHLHFGAFASKAVEITSIRSRVCGTLMTLPISAVNGYLDPMDYL